ncbi:MAG: hypothetical protein ABEJ84_03650 [Halodesulfurarchaeum sp.]
MTGQDTHARDRSDRLDAPRRELLRRIGIGAIAGGFARVFYEYTGFGHLTATNLRRQDLEPLLRDRLEPSPFSVPVADGRFWFTGEEWNSAAAENGAERGSVAGSTRQTDGHHDHLTDRFSRDLRALRSGDFTVPVLSLSDFLDRGGEGRTRPLAVAALRGEGFQSPDPEMIRRFTGVDPADIRAVIDGLGSGFRAHTHFDARRYLAAAIERYLLLETIPVADPSRDPTDFEAILTGSTGLYCYEYALRSIEAFHAIEPTRQSIPVFGGIVIDDRHNHAYTALGTVLREAGGLRLPFTFVDYFYTALFDSLRAGWLVGEEIGAYDRFHRATRVHYDNVYG